MVAVGAVAAVGAAAALLISTATPQPPSGAPRGDVDPVALVQGDKHELAPRVVPEPRDDRPAMQVIARALPTTVPEPSTPQTFVIPPELEGYSRQWSAQAGEMQVHSPVAPVSRQVPYLIPPEMMGRVVGARAQDGVIVLAGSAPADLGAAAGLRLVLPPGVQTAALVDGAAGEYRMHGTSTTQASASDPAALRAVPPPGLIDAQMQ